MEVAIIDWRDDLEAFDVVMLDKPIVYFETAREAVDFVVEQGRDIVVAEGIDVRRLIEVTAAAIFAGKSVYRRDGTLVSDPERPSPPPRYITRAELGPLLPDGWYIEVQHGRYAACFGEQHQLPFRPKITKAIEDIRTFLALSINQNSRDLVESLRAAPKLEEMEQQSF